jgi:hypothetical protein
MAVLKGSPSGGVHEAARNAAAAAAAAATTTTSAPNLVSTSVMEDVSISSLSSAMGTRTLFFSSVLVDEDDVMRILLLVLALTVLATLEFGNNGRLIC